MREFIVRDVKGKAARDRDADSAEEMQAPPPKGIFPSDQDGVPKDLIVVEVIEPAADIPERDDSPRVYIVPRKEGVALDEPHALPPARPAPTAAQKTYQVPAPPKPVAARTPGRVAARPAARTAAQHLSASKAPKQKKRGERDFIIAYDGAFVGFFEAVEEISPREAFMRIAQEMSEKETFDAAKLELYKPVLLKSARPSKTVCVVRGKIASLAWQRRTSATSPESPLSTNDAPVPASREAPPEPPEIST
ncbi:MAG TPA: hypothetical protein VMT52_02375 [Planctomycetota bacterium]|nr:hypothetical protein [Planctomycetota bacterium]